MLSELDNDRSTARPHLERCLDRLLIYSETAMSIDVLAPSIDTAKFYPLGSSRKYRCRRSMSILTASRVDRKLFTLWPQYFAGEHDGLSFRPHTKLLRSIMSQSTSITNDVHF
jgi:hypothetical protein